MPKNTAIATPRQEAHMRQWLSDLCIDRHQTMTALSVSLIGSMRLLAFMRGASLTQTLLTRVLIGCKAQGLAIHAEMILGSAESAFLPAVAEEETCPGPPDPLLQCMQCLMDAMTELTATSQQLTAAFTACIQAMQEVNA